MNTILAIDGFDGAGKSTVTELIAQSSKSRCISPSRRGSNSDHLTRNLTEIVLQIDSGKISTNSRSNYLIRLARMEQRLSLASKYGHSNVLFDRWFVSDLSRLAPDIRNEALRNFTELHLQFNVKLVKVHVDFETAWSRIEERPWLERSPSEKRGKLYCSKYFNNMEYIWQILEENRGLDITVLDGSKGIAELKNEISNLVINFDL